MISENSDTCLIAWLNHVYMNSDITAGRLNLLNDGRIVETTTCVCLLYRIDAQAERRYNFCVRQD